jgi:hypothetical protein
MANVNTSRVATVRGTEERGGGMIAAVDTVDVAAADGWDITSLGKVIKW